MIGCVQKFRALKNVHRRFSSELEQILSRLPERFSALFLFLLFPAFFSALFSSRRVSPGELQRLKSLLSSAKRSFLRTFVLGGRWSLSFLKWESYCELKCNEDPRNRNYKQCLEFRFSFSLCLTVNQGKKTDRNSRCSSSNGNMEYRKIENWLDFFSSNCFLLLNYLGSKWFILRFLKKLFFLSLSFSSSYSLRLQLPLAASLTSCVQVVYSTLSDN